MERRGLALCLLALFMALTVLATVIAGSRAAMNPGWAPWILQVAGYLSAVAGGVLLLTVPGPGNRSAGFVVLGTVTVLALLDAATADQDGANIGAGLVRLVCLGAVVAVTVRVGVAAASGDRRP